MYRVTYISAIDGTPSTKKFTDKQRDKAFREYEFAIRSPYVLAAVLMGDGSEALRAFAVGRFDLARNKS